MDKIRVILVFSIGITALFGCTHSHPPGEGHDHAHDNHTHDDHGSHVHGEHPEGEIHLTAEQMNTMNIKLGTFSQIKINDAVEVTGTLGLPPNAYSSVSAKAAGFIKHSRKYVEGDYVKKGVIMAYLENPDFIEIQREYLETQAKLTYLQQDLRRQKELNAAGAGIEKNEQKLTSEVNLHTATLAALAKQMNYLGMDADRLSPDNITERIPIISPMAGYLTSIQMHNGMYVEPSRELMEIVSENHLHLELDVFERDIAAVIKGQKISYRIPALGSETFTGKVEVIGKEFNPENKTVRVHGHPEGKQPPFIKDLYVEAKIWLNDQTVQALPDKAIVTDGAMSYIYVTNDRRAGEDFIFEQMQIVPGVRDNGYTAVKTTEKLPAGKQIVTEGAYYVYAQSKVGELEHSH